MLITQVLLAKFVASLADWTPSNIVGLVV